MIFASKVVELYRGQICSDHNKSIILEVNPENGLIESLQDCVKKWIEKIELNANQFNLEITKPNETTHGAIIIKYNNEVVGKIAINRSRPRHHNGMTSLSASLTLTCFDNIESFLKGSKQQIIHIHDTCFTTCHTVNGKFMNLAEVLNCILPLRCDRIVKDICKEFEAGMEDVYFDTYLNKYIIDSAILNNILGNPNQPEYVYRYVSLPVFLSMMKDKSFRLNSITSQEDQNESIFFENFLSGTYDEPIDRAREIKKEQNILISCFTTEKDNPMMWEEYAGGGTGVMLEFKPFRKNILTPICYIDKDEQKWREIKNKILAFKKEGVNIGFKGLENKRRFIKSDKYRHEAEWRLLDEYKGDLQSTLYGNRIAYFNEYPFTKNDLLDLGLSLTSVKCGPNMPPNNIPFIMEQISTTFENVDILLT